jgi:uncharacterized MnhB-related membrane protein
VVSRQAIITDSNGAIHSYSAIVVVVYTILYAPDPNRSSSQPPRSLVAQQESKRWSTGAVVSRQAIITICNGAIHHYSAIVVVVYTILYAPDPNRSIGQSPRAMVTQYESKRWFPNGQGIKSTCPVVSPKRYRWYAIYTDAVLDECHQSFRDTANE